MRIVNAARGFRTYFSQRKPGTQAKYQVTWYERRYPGVMLTGCVTDPRRCAPGGIRRALRLGVDSVDLLPQYSGKE